MGRPRPGAGGPARRRAAGARSGGRGRAHRTTSVPGLAAKPVLDVQIGCAPGETDAVVGHVRSLGFEYLGEAGVPGRHYPRRRDEQPADVHAVELGGPLWTDNLLFRDHLRAHPEEAARYARAKREAAGATGRPLAYSVHKTATVAELLARAREARA
ncbi:GrpB family protein [Kitasatospora aureofaciens]|uniref:GrpB family protein n=1 Tax=Kitasatospora aureofaciens TaxID=1894 RepID=UPI0037CA1ED9